MRSTLFQTRKAFAPHLTGDSRLTMTNSDQGRKAGVSSINHRRYDQQHSLQR
jgi:hypothetical protein